MSDASDLRLPAADNWGDLNFTNFQQILEAQSSKITESQEEGVASRKALSSKTKAFRKLNDEEKLGEMRGLLKSYQAEIDKLTSRCKFAEGCFLDVYKSMALLPDPETLLDSKQGEIDRLKTISASSVGSSNKDSALARELERQTLRVSQLEKQLKSLDESRSSPSSGATIATDTVQASNQRIEELETELAASKSQLATSQASLKQLKEVSAKQQADIQNILTKQLPQKDYDDLKKELLALKSRASSIEYDDLDGSEQDASAKAGQRKLLRKLESENNDLKEKVNSLHDESSKLKALISKLEDDLSALQPSETFSTVSGWTAVPRGGGINSTTGTTGTGSGVASVSNIIVQQRDRYKKRVQELEEKSHQTEAALEQTRKEYDTVKRESYTLYDRIRQLQAAAPGVALSTMHGSKSLYEPLPEQQLKELDIERRTAGLSPANAKLVRIFARAVVDQKVRYGMTTYAIALHIIALAGFVL